LKKVVKISKAESRGIRPYVLWFRFETEATLGGAVFSLGKCPGLGSKGIQMQKLAFLVAR
jgi:hypothetical protein